MLRLSCHKLFLARLQVERLCVPFTWQKGRVLRKYFGCGFEAGFLAQFPDDGALTGDSVSFHPLPPHSHGHGHTLSSCPVGLVRFWEGHFGTEPGASHRLQHQQRPLVGLGCKAEVTEGPVLPYHGSKKKGWAVPLSYRPVSLTSLFLHPTMSTVSQTPKLCLLKRDLCSSQQLLRSVYP